MKKYIVKNLDDMPLEGTHDLPDSRQTLLTPEEHNSKNFHAFTKGILRSGKIWDWHNHEGIYEFFVVIKGKGEIFFEDDSIHQYREGDVIAVTAGFKHIIVAGGEAASEFFFVRFS